MITVYDDGTFTDTKSDNAKSDKGKIRLSLVPTNIIKAIAHVREYGNKKYHSPDNWKKVDTRRYVDALLRHTIRVAEDIDSIDPESGLPHLWHCACNLAFIIQQMYPYIDMDKLADYRPKVYELPRLTKEEFDKLKEGDCQWH